MRDINVLEQRPCLHIPRVVLGGVIQGKAETAKTAVPSPRLPVSPDFCSEAAQKLLSPRTPTAACTLLGLPTLRIPRAARTVTGQECQTNRLIVKFRGNCKIEIQYYKFASGEGEIL